MASRKIFDDSGCCPVVGGTDFLTNALGRVGIKRSLLITLALLPFAANGLLWVANLIGHGYEAISYGVSIYAESLGLQ